MISVKDYAAIAHLSGSYDLWKDLILGLRPELAATPAPHSVCDALSGYHDVYVANVPDFDQRWNVLPNKGQNYCSPTSALNWMRYMSLHGAPTADFGGSIPDGIQLMADYMDTDADSGTDSDDAVEGMLDWCEDRGVSVVIFGLDYTGGVQIRYDLLRSTLLFGGLVNLRIGWYYSNDDGWERDGGHAVSLVGLDHTAGKMILHVHDPNDEKTDLTTQSDINTIQHPTHEVYETLEGDAAWVLHYQDQFIDPNILNPKFTPAAFVIGLHNIMSPYAVADMASGGVELYKASLGSSIVSQSFEAPFSGGVGDIALYPGWPIASVLAKQSGEIWNLDLGTGEWRHHATVRNAKCLTYFGRSNALEASTSDAMTMLNFRGEVTQQFVMDVDIDDLAYDYRSAMLLAASSQSGRVLCFTPDLRSRIELSELVPSGTGRVVLSLDARNRSVTVSRTGSDDVRRTVLPWGLRERPRSKSVSREDMSRPVRHYVERGEVVAQHADGSRVRGSLLDGIKGQTVVRVAQSAHNIDPRRTGTRKWRDQ
jgi:hypothetical protein